MFSNPSYLAKYPWSSPTAPYYNQLYLHPLLTCSFPLPRYTPVLRGSPCCSPKLQGSFWRMDEFQKCAKSRLSHWFSDQVCWWPFIRTRSLLFIGRGFYGQKGGFLFPFSICLLRIVEYFSYRYSDFSFLCGPRFWVRCRTWSCGWIHKLCWINE